MKTIGTAYWESPNIGAINLSGFSALPGGYRNTVGSFIYIRDNAFLWSATEYDNSLAWIRILLYNSGGVSRYDFTKSVGASVRCLRD
jgi:uncharacterized protein (TIGR02145 family)